MARPGFRNHPKFRRLTKLLQLPGPHVLGHCEYLWSVAYESGNAVIGDAMDVELAAGWEGEDGRLCRALLDCGGTGRPGLIEDVPESPATFRVHDLMDHAPDYVQGRAAKEAERSRDKACAHCSTAFRSPDVRAMYCSDRCKVAACRHRMKPIATEASVTETDGNVSQPTETDCNRSPAPAPAPAPVEKSGKAAGPTTPLPGFDLFWEAWPSHFRKADKKKCGEKWRAERLEDRTDEIVAAVEWFKRSEPWREKNGKFIPGPLPWLNGEGWQGAQAAQAGSRPSNGTGPPGDRPSGPVMP